MTLMCGASDGHAFTETYIGAKLIIIDLYFFFLTTSDFKYKNISFIQAVLS